MTTVDDRPPQPANFGGVPVGFAFLVNGVRFTKVQPESGDLNALRHTDAMVQHLDDAAGVSDVCESEIHLKQA